MTIIPCNEIQQTITQLLIAFQNCKKIKNSDLTKLVDLVTAVDNCNSGEIDQDNFVRKLYISDNDLPEEYTEQDIVDYILSLPEEERTVAETDSKWNIIIDLGEGAIDRIYELQNIGKGVIEVLDYYENLLLIDTTFDQSDYDLQFFNNDGSDPYVHQSDLLNLQPLVFDGIIGVTSGFTVGQQTFTLPEGAICIEVRLAHEYQYKTTTNNTSLVNRWSQTGDDVTLTLTPVLNNYINIKYIQL